MNPAWETTARIAAVLVPLAAALIGVAQGPGRLRARLKTDVEILEKLPENSDARELMLELVDAKTRQLRELELVRSRDPIGTVVGVVGTAGLGWLTVWLAQRDAAWGSILAFVTGVLALFFTIGIFISARRVPRDPKGRERKGGDDAA
jgi:amino acid transporter